MSEPIFLTVAEVEYLHARSIQRYGGTLGVRDYGGVHSAVNQPKNLYYYGQGDLFDIAAGYAFHIAEAQAFLDGNKRAAVAAALQFLEKNGVVILYESRKIYELMIGIAERRVTQSDLAAFFREQRRQDSP